MTHRVAFAPLNPNTTPNQYQTPKSNPKPTSAYQSSKHSASKMAVDHVTPLKSRAKKREPEEGTRAEQLAHKIAKTQEIVTPETEEIYNGDLVAGVRHGNGDLFYPNGDKYSGPFVKGRRHGLGTLFHTDGSKYYGNFTDGKICGNGTYIQANGDIWQLRSNNKERGQLSIRFANHDVLEVVLENSDGFGNGTLAYANGDRYVGQFMGDKPQGEGTLIYKNKNVYVGQFFHGQAHGAGTLHYENGDKYVGDFFGDLAHGRGILMYENGDNYQGSFVLGKIEGKGIFTYANGCFYDGEMRDGNPHGTGTLHLRTSNKDPAPNCRFLRWEFSHYSLGNIYKGEFHQGGFQKGTIFYANGDRYEGQCHYNMPNGQGKRTFGDGRDPMEGTYTDGLLDISIGLDWESYSSEGT